MKFDYTAKDIYCWQDHFALWPRTVQTGHDTNNNLRVYTFMWLETIQRKRAESPKGEYWVYKPKLK